MDKEHIIEEIRRTARENGEVPLGMSRFFSQTGIKESDWRGKYWVRWGDALVEAGYEPNKMQSGYDEIYLIERLVVLMREIGHFPVVAELKLKSRNDKEFPSHNVFTRCFGTKAKIATTILSHFKDNPEYSDIVSYCIPLTRKIHDNFDTEQEMGQEFSTGDTDTKLGYVYLALMRIGRERRYKIGKAILVERRKDQIAIQLPEDLVLIHTISTDDAYGIEEYWHKRFARKNTKGEWFMLTRQDVDAFKRRKFM